MIPRMIQNRLKRRLIHSRHPRTIVLFCKSFNVTVYRDRSDTGLKVEKAVSFDTQPVGNISGICKCGGKTHNSDLALCLL